MKDVEIPSWAQQVLVVGVRKGVTIIGAGLASRGLVMEGGFAPGTTDQLVGASMTIVGIVWSVWAEWQKRQQLKTAIQAPAATPVTK